MVEAQRDRTVMPLPTLFPGTLAMTVPSNPAFHLYLVSFSDLPCPSCDWSAMLFCSLASCKHIEVAELTLLLLFARLYKGALAFYVKKLSL